MLKRGFPPIDFIRLLPLLVLYIAVILILSTNSLEGDEGRYMMFAKNLSNGYYSPIEKPNIWNGPGYPIVLVPFVLLKLPWLSAKLMNTLFLFFGVVYFGRALRLYLNERQSLALSYLLGLYPPFFYKIHMLSTESLVIFLVCGFIFHFCMLFRQGKSQFVHVLLASFFLGFLALTKFFFGYVIMVGLVSFPILFMIKRVAGLKKCAAVSVMAFLICIPWLIYTYSLTGKILYWGSSGGMSLYWMSSPHKGDLGDWHSTSRVLKNPELYENHFEFFQKISALDYIQRDDKFKKKAITQIKDNPQKYVFNWMANLGRLFFSYPFSYTPQKMTTFFFLAPNMFIVVISILCIYPSYVGRRGIPLEIWCLFAFFLISLGGTSLLSAYERQFRPLIPFLLLWIALTIFRVMRIEIRK